MQILSIVLGVVIGFIIEPFIILIISQIIDKRFERKFKNGKHHCNNCEVSFCSDYEDLTYKFCPLCGKELNYFKENIKEGEN